VTLRPLLIALLAVGCGRAGLDPAVCDRGAVLAAPDREALADQAGLVERESGARVRYELGSAGSEPGGTPRDGRGIAFRYDAEHERLRIDVGYALEGLLPDARVGDWIDATARPLFESGRPATALLLATRMLQYELRQAQLIAPLERVELPEGGGGAGAEAAVQLANRVAPALHATAGARADLQPAASVDEAYARYLRWLERGRFEVDAALFTAGTRSFLAEWPMAPGYLEHIAARESGQPYGVIERGDRALLYFTGSPFVAPHFFVRGSRGWQMDLAAEADEVIGIAGGPYSWGLRSSRSAALAPFADEIVRPGGFLRLREGDNRRLDPPLPHDSRPVPCTAG
jgi:hypothetical protein